MANVTIVHQPVQVQTVSAAGQQNTPETGKATTLAHGSVVSGTIIGKDAGGNFVLRTANEGNIALRSATPLTYNSDVQIRIGSSATGGTTARILTVNGQPFDGTAPQPAENTDTVSNSLLAQAAQDTPAGASQEQVTVPLRAVVVAPAPAAPPAPAAANAGTGNAAHSAAPPNAATLNMGDNVIVHVPSPQNAAATAQQAATSVGQQAVTSQQAVVIAPLPGSPQQAIPAAQQGVAIPQAIVSAAGTELSGAQVVPQTNEAAAPAIQQSSPQASVALSEQPAAAAQSAATPGGKTAAPAPSVALYAAYARQPGASPAPPAPPPPTSAAAPQLLQAQVASNNPDGSITLQTPAGNVTVQPEALPQGISLAPGTAVQIEFASGQAAATPVPVSTTPAPLSEIALGWSTLKDIISVTGSTTPGIAAVNSPVLASLPQLGPAFAASSMSFISAVAEGNLRKLLGDGTIAALKQVGRTDLLERFSGELGSVSQSMAQAAARPMPGWQMIFMPFVYQEALQQARIYIKRDAPKKEKAPGQSGGDTRFIVEVDLSEIGPLQMDGLVRKQEKSTAFDLVIRSRNGFSNQQRAEISAIYADAAAMTGFKGTLGFQVTHDFPVKPLDEATLAGTRSITV